MSSNLKANTYRKYRATLGFRVGEIANKNVTDSSIAKDQIIQFDGTFVKVNDNEYKAPGLVQAINGGWLVDADKPHKEKSKPVVRDEVSRPLGSEQKEPRVRYEITVDDYDFDAHWQKKQSMLNEINSVEMLEEIVERESGKTKDRAQKRLDEVKNEISEVGREKLKTGVSVDADDDIGLMNAINNDEPMERSSYIQTPAGRKKKAKMEREAYEEEKKDLNRSSKKAPSEKKKTEIKRDESLIEGSASGVKERTKPTNKRNRSQRSTETN